MPNPTDLADGPRIRVLVVDDNQAFLRIAVDFFQRYRELLVVGAVYGGKEALAQACDLHPQVILIDLDMPGLSGLETIRGLRALMPHVGIIAMSLLNTSGYRQAALATGADGFVSKRNLSTDLLPAIRRVARTVLPGQELTELETVSMK